MIIAMSYPYDFNLNFEALLKKKRQKTNNLILILLLTISCWAFLRNIYFCRNNKTTSLCRKIEK